MNIIVVTHLKKNTWLVKNEDHVVLSELFFGVKI